MEETMPDSAQERVIKTRPVEDFYDAFWQTGPDTLGGKYLRQFWHPIALSESVAPGTAKPIRLMSEDFTLYRGETGTLHLTEKHCPHRRTQLSVGYVEGDAIRCLYHGWKFGPDGGCVERPAEPGTASHIWIKTYAVDEFLGVIFAYTGQNPAPAFPPFPAFEEEGVLVTEEQLFECNHFQSWENDWDLYHAAWTHKQGEIHGPAAGPQRHDFYNMLLRTSTYEEVDYGVLRHFTVPGGIKNTTVLMMPSHVRLLIPTFNEENRRGLGPQFRDTYILHSPTDDVTHYAFLIQLVPFTGKDAEDFKARRAEVQKLQASVPDEAIIGREILAGKSRLAEHKAHPFFVAIEDTAAQVGQGIIADRNKEMLGMSDAGVVYLRRLLARELTLFAEGLPTKPWTTEFTLPKMEMPTGGPPVSK
jgi:5,5'-dehydrodivanillate O-demethylase